MSEYLISLVVAATLAIFVFALFRRAWRVIDVPECWGDFPHRYPQDEAERDCRNCRHLRSCFTGTPYERERP